MDNVLSGKARIALAITEPEAGSDVRGLKTEAVLSDDGARLTVNGQKKVSPLQCLFAAFKCHVLVLFHRRKRR